MPARILIADDDPDILSGLKQRLEWGGHQALTAKDGAEALAVIQQDRPSLILLDLELPIMTGIEVLERLRSGSPGLGSDRHAPNDIQTITPPVIMLTAFGTINRAVEAMKLGATDFLTKPFDLNHLECLIRNVLDRQSLAKEVTQLRSQVDSRYATIVAESRKMKDVLAFVQRAAPSDAAVLVLGETGTGKELIARAIHRWSGRADRCFMAVNCAALPEHLLENELFGHERGAFTGANYTQEGKIEAAEGGTVFLDEIGDMSLALQSRLLRLLQDKEFHRIGGTRQIRVDVRFVAATNKDLALAVRTGTFREDLYYRLNVLPVTLPPLRERQEDILPLAAHVIAREGGRYRSEKKRFTPQAEEALCHYHWPGNIRELENVIARAVILSDHRDIPAELLGLPAVGSTPDKAGLAEDAAPASYHHSMESHSRWLIREALRKADGNQTRAAALLELQRTYFTKLLKQKGITAKRPDP
ncbi:MAG: sigma-54-dependent Fis family transcriptional regulator [Nitrospira sp.]|nr:sigma-54-dependent Fis family transcriptional regulator [Nitrospira sp.]